MFDTNHYHYHLPKPSSPRAWLLVWLLIELLRLVMVLLRSIGRLLGPRNTVIAVLSLIIVLVTMQVLNGPMA